MSRAVPDAVALTPAETERAVPRSRMGIALLSLLGFFIAGYLLLHRMGMVGPLTCGLGDCATVQLSRWSVFLGIPVPAWGVGGYAALFVVSLLGIQPQYVEARWISAALVGMSAIAFLFSAYLTALEAFVIHAWCQWCVVSAIIATGIFLFSLAELARLRRR